MNDAGKLNINNVHLATLQAWGDGIDGKQAVALPSSVQKSRERTIFWVIHRWHRNLKNKTKCHKYFDGLL